MSANSNTYIVGDYSSSGVTEVIAGTNVTISGTIALPIINATGGGIDVSNGIGIIVSGTNPKILSTNLVAGTNINLTPNPDNSLTITAGGVTDFRPAYTIFVSTNGNDSTGTGSYLNPFQTIGRALTARNAITDTIEVGISIAEGNYTENPTITTGRTYLYGAASNSRQQAVNIVGSITINIPSISTIGTEYVVGINSVQLTGNINAQAAASGPFTVVIGNCLIAGNIILTRTGASAASARIQNNTITCGGGDTIGLNFGGFAVTLLNNVITCNATTQPCIQLLNATGFAVAGTLLMNYNILTYAGAGTTLGACIKHNSTSNAVGNQCNYNLFQYTSTATDTGSQNKCIIQQTSAASTTYDTVCYNVMLVPGASFTGGAGQPVVLQERGGSFIINSFGGNYALPTAFRIDNNISHTQLSLVS